MEILFTFNILIKLKLSLFFLLWYLQVQYNAEKSTAQFLLCK